MILRPLSDVDMDMLRGWRNDPAIYRWCRQHTPLEKWEHCRWLVGLESRSDIKMFSIWFDEKPIGVCGLTDIDLINRSAEFSLYIAKEFHGLGQGTRALMALVDYGFSTLGLNHIFGETFDGNPAASMFQKVGFVKEGTRRQFYYREGKYLDAHLYSILRDEWK